MSASVDAIYDLGISHNKFGVPLPDGTAYPEHAVSVTGARATEFLTNFNRVRDKVWSECSFMDLGCSEGSTTFEISQMGSTVYGVEGREDAVRRARVLKEILNFDSTNFEVGNVNDGAIYRDVDGIFNAGVLYHLEDPVTCLKRCADHARLFIYLDTGHKPRSQNELENSRFARNFGAPHKLHYDGLEIDAIDFAEPGNPSERHADGLRRGPRSGIGNSNSVWLSHESTVELMAKLGFPYHEVTKEAAIIPRFRTCFFRSEAPKKLLGPLLQPLPKVRSNAIERVRKRDIAYLRRKAEPVLLIGVEPMLSMIRRELDDLGIAVREEIALPSEGAPQRRALVELTRDKSGLVVVAVQDVTKIVPALMIIDRFDYAFSSFSMAKVAEPA